MEPVPVSNFSSEVMCAAPSTREMLDYCAAGALQADNDITYDQDTDRVIYHYKPDANDRELYPRLFDVAEVWIITEGIGRLN